MLKAKAKTKAITGAREFFSGEIKRVMERQQVSARAESHNYLTDLMLRYMHSDSFFSKSPTGKNENTTLVELYQQYLQASPEKQKVTLRRLGDISLLVSGFFAESLKQKIVDLEYYYGMGESAYSTLAQLQTTQARLVYEELARKFVAFSDVLHELSERTGLQSNTDLLRLYERWLVTGSGRTREVLSEHGITTPIRVDTKKKN